MGTSASTVEDQSPPPSLPLRTPSPAVSPTPPPSPRATTLNPILVDYLKFHFNNGTDITDKIFEDIDNWIKILGRTTHCAGCKNRLPIMDWQCCDNCLEVVCDKCDYCAYCNIEQNAATADACLGCGAADVDGLCYDCRREG